MPTARKKTKRATKTKARTTKTRTKTAKKAPRKGKAPKRPARTSSARKPPARKTPARKAGTRRGTRRSTTPTQPTNIRNVTPHLAVNGAARAIDWYQKAFGAKVVSQTPIPGGMVMHAELRIGDSSIFLADIFPGSPVKDPKTAGPSVTIHIHHKDADRIWKKAVGEGAKVVMPFEDQFWGDRYGQLVDPFGHSWSLGRKADLSAAELRKLEQQAMEMFSTVMPGMA